MCFLCFGHFNDRNEPCKAALGLFYIPHAYHMMRTRTSSSLTFCVLQRLAQPCAGDTRTGGGGAWSRQVQVLYAAATLAHEFLADKERVAPRALVETAVYLHDIVLSLQGLQGEALRRVIAKVNGPAVATTAVLWNYVVV